MAAPVIKASYRVTGPKKVKQDYMKCWMDKETGSLQQKPATREVDLFMVYLPRGHSIRVNAKELKRLGYDKRPRLIDMNTGDVLEAGGDPYDFANEIADDNGANIILDDEEDSEAPSSGGKK